MTDASKLGEAIRQRSRKPIYRHWRAAPSFHILSVPATEKCLQTVSRSFPGEGRFGGRPTGRSKIEFRDRI